LKKQNSIIIILLVLSLAFNVYTIIKLNNLRELTANDYSYYLEKTVGEDLDEIKDIIHQINEEQQWISEVEVNDGGILGDKQIVKISWQIKDFISGSKVRFYYRKSGQEEFQQIPVTSQSIGTYNLELGIENENQPQMIVSYQYNDEAYGILQDKSPDYKSLYNYEYYIVLEDGNHISCSEIKVINLKKMIQKYSFVEAEVFINKEKKPSAIKLQWDEETIIPDKIVLELFDNDKITEAKLKIDDEGTSEWKSDNLSFNKVIVRVQYDDGKILIKEL